MTSWIQSGAVVVIAFSAAVPLYGQDASTASLEVDNTAHNVRDRSMATSTPLDQGNDTTDTATTRDIRRAVMKAENMSINARNVKIITNAGKVVLRGPVNTDDEKRRIQDIAESVAGSGNVDDEIEVKSTNSQ